MESDALLLVSADHAEIPMLDQVLMMKEVAPLLTPDEKTMYAMAQAGEIPAIKILGQRRIKRTEFERRAALIAAAVTGRLHGIGSAA